MKKPVSPSEYQSAHHAVDKITPAISALKRIDKQSLSYDEDAWAKSEELIEFFSQFLAKNQTIIDRGIAQYDNRPQELINKAAFRMNRIPELISHEEKTLKHKLDAREAQADELRKKHFTAGQIDQIAPPVSRAEIDTSKAIVTGLKAEAEAIQKFLADSPRYDLGLLAGTSLIELENEKVAA